MCCRLHWDVLETSSSSASDLHDRASQRAGVVSFLEDPAQLAIAMRTRSSTAGQVVEHEAFVHWLASVGHQMAMSPSHLSA